MGRAIPVRATSSELKLGFAAAAATNGNPILFGS